MFGFLIGTACAFGVAALAARRHHRFHHHGRGHHGRGFRRRWMRRVFERLDTTPGQEKVIATAIDDFREYAAAAKENLEDTRKKVAEAIDAEHLDEREFGHIFDEPLERLREIRDEFAKTVTTIHETLTPRQREQLSGVIGRGTRWGFHPRHAC